MRFYATFNFRWAYFDSFRWCLHLSVDCAHGCSKNPFWASLRHLSAELSNWTNNVNWWSTSFNEKSISKLDVKPWRVLSKISHRSEETFDQILIFYIVILPFLIFLPTTLPCWQGCWGLGKIYSPSLHEKCQDLHTTHLPNSNTPSPTNYSQTLGDNYITYHTVSKPVETSQKKHMLSTLVE